MKWSERDALDCLDLPGVYAIARSRRNIAGHPFSYRRQIIYFGMTNSRGGLRARLRQFDNTIKGKRGHSGGRRTREKHPDYLKLAPRLYVSVCPYECEVASRRPRDLRVMGEVAKREYDCFARFVRRFGRLPEFNDKERLRGNG